mmetsp:Transcript_26140/g.41047  ORF Transcript_26140/g.41047 Transcript_26140/m.41047 type:complete len:269 (-) Transcript_26140:97-903(-)
MRNNSISRKHSPLPINRQLFNHRIIRSSYRIKFLRLHPLERSRRPSRHLIILIIILIEKSSKGQILHPLGRRIVHQTGQRGGPLGQFTKINILDTTPIGTDRHRGLSIDTIAPLSTTTATSSTGPTSSPSTGTSTLRLIESSNPTNILIILTTSIKLTQPCCILSTLSCLRDEAFSSPARSALCSGGTNIGRIDQLKFFGLLAVNFILKLQVFIGIVTCGTATEVSSCSISGPSEGLGGEIGAPAETIGAAEGGVGEGGEAAYGGIGV